MISEQTPEVKPSRIQIAMKPGSFFLLYLTLILITILIILTGRWLKLPQEPETQNPKSYKIINRTEKHEKCFCCIDLHVEFRLCL